MLRIIRYPAPNSRYPTRPSTPTCFTWRRYMPVMPTSARAAISTFSELRTAHSVVSTEVTSEWGCLIWTPMKISPAAMAATPAARLRVAGVGVMSVALLLVRDGRRGDAWNLEREGVVRRHQMM